MQLRAAHLKTPGRRPLAVALLAALVFAGAGPVAAEPFSDFRKPGTRVGQSQPDLAAARCARYGEGFVPIVGSDGCVKIGGRVRIDLGASAQAPVFAGPRDGINPAAHLRLGR